MKTPSLGPDPEKVYWFQQVQRSPERSEWTNRHKATPSSTLKSQYWSDLTSFPSSYSSRPWPNSWTVWTAGGAALSEPPQIWTEPATLNQIKIWAKITCTETETDEKERGANPHRVLQMGLSLTLVGLQEKRFPLQESEETNEIQLLAPSLLNKCQSQMSVGGKLS